MVPSSHADCAPWAFGTSPSHRPHLGRTALPNGRQNASVVAQGCADLSFGSANRPPKFARYLGWTSSSIRSDLVFGTHRDSRGFTTSEIGELFRSDHPQSLRNRVLVAEGPEHYAIWKHLPDIIRDGKQNGFIREFGAFRFRICQNEYQL